MSKIRCVWSYLSTDFFDFLQVWRACKDKAAALPKCRSSLQSRGGQSLPMQTTKPQDSSCTLPWPAFPPSSAREELCSCAQGRSCFPEAEGLGSMASPCHEGPEGTRGACVTAWVQGAVSELLQLSDTHAWLSWLSSDLAFMRWAEYSWKMCGLGFANIDFSFWEVKMRRFYLYPHNSYTSTYRYDIACWHQMSTFGYSTHKENLFQAHKNLLYKILFFYFYGSVKEMIKYIFFP